MPAPHHSMITWGALGVKKSNPKYALSVGISTPTPASVSQAIKHPEWHAAMQEEYNALIRNSTWSLVSPPVTHNIIGCKWIFRVKEHSNGTTERYKARLVA